MKDIPDNIIFHLKRFDYDLMTGTRSKVNEYFEFPQEIDMTPYHVDHLKEPPQDTSPDKFMLVGILVHSGTAEIGHYYSYIRERPGMKGSWVEMNDADVSVFDPASIRDHCFGGWQEQPYSGVQYPKSWNAYMLFYQRITSMEADRERFDSADGSTPVHAPMPIDLMNRVTCNNETWIRKYCLLGHEYAVFARRVIEHYWQVKEDSCSEDHEIERDLIGMALSQMEMIFARAKDCQRDRDQIYNCLVKMTERCTTCCAMFLTKILSVENRQMFRALLLKCPDESSRRRFQIIIFSSLKDLKEREISLYAPEMVLADHDLSSPAEHKSRLFSQAVDALAWLVDLMHLHTRSWDEFYGMLIKLSLLGHFEKAALHRASFLTNALQILFCEVRRSAPIRWNNADNYLKTRNKRRISFNNLVMFVYYMLIGATHPEFAGEKDSSVSRAEKYRLTAHEHNLLKHFGPDGGEAFASSGCVLHSVLTADSLDPSTIQKFTQAMLESPYASKKMRELVCNTVLAGVYLEPISLPQSFLLAGITICENTPEPRDARRILKTFAEEIRTLTHAAGVEHVDFFSRIVQAYNHHFHTELPTFFPDEVLKMLHTFAPILAFHPEIEVRQRTRQLISTLLFERTMDDDEELVDNLVSARKRLMVGWVDVARTVTMQRKSIESSRYNDFVKLASHCLTAFPEYDDEEWENFKRQVQCKHVLESDP